MRWWSRLLRRDRMERDLGRELQFHLEERVQALQSAGLSEDEARRRTRQEFGGAEQVKEECRQARGTLWAESILGDLRYAVRTLIKSPGFTLAAVFTLALGIAASTAIFSVIDAVLLRALPYPQPDSIVRVWEQAPDGHRMNLTDPNFDDFQAQNSTLETLARYSGNVLSSVAGGSEPVRANVAAVSSGFFETLRIAPLRGRAFGPVDHLPGSATAAIVSYRYWDRYLARTGDLSKVHLRIEGRVYPVIGVMPGQFDFPSGATIWIPIEVYPRIASRSSHNWRGIGRLRHGVTPAQARADLDTIARRIRQQYGKDADLSDAAMVPLANDLVGNVRAGLLTLSGAVSLLFLIACANVAGLSVARISSHRKELAVRAALGAGRGRLLQQFFIESLVLSFTAGTLGVLLALWAIWAIPGILPPGFPREQGIVLNGRALLFALTATVAVAASLGLFAAWRAWSRDLQNSLTAAGSRSYSGGSAQTRLRTVVVTAEIAMTLIILIGAGLLGHSFLRLVATSPGFSQRNLITVEFAPPNREGQAFVVDGAAIARQARLIEDVIARLRTIPGVESVGVAGALPVAAGDNLADGTFLLLKGQAPPVTAEQWQRIAQNPAQTGYALYAVASEAYFHALGMPLIKGRFFNEQDTFRSPHVAVISEALARERWPRDNPIGQVIEFGNMDGNFKPLTIVGIAGDVRARGLDAPPSPIIYVDYRQRGMNINSSPTILMRSTAAPATLVAAGRRIFHDLAPDVPVKFSTFADEMGGWFADRRFLLLLVASFAAAALALAAIGVYGVIAFSVARRTQEIGVRMALGAQRTHVLQMVVGEGARLALLGVSIGLAASFAITRLLTSLLFGVSPTDPITFGGVAMLLLFIAMLASYVPARRALRLDPLHALRYE